MKLKLKTEYPGLLLVSFFYAAIGVIFAVILVFLGFKPPHVGVLAVLNLMLSYGLFKMRKWSVKLLAALFLPQVVFGVITLYLSFIMRTSSSTWETIVFDLLLVFYVVLCLVSLVYVSAKRKDFK